MYDQMQRFRCKNCGRDRPITAYIAGLFRYGKRLDICDGCDKHPITERRKYIRGEQ